MNRVLSPVLVGRHEELSQLEDALLAANRGDGRFVLLGGEAGIGKTRLARELERRARKLGGDVLWGSCSEAELSLPYLPFVEAIGKRLDEHEASAVRAELGPIVGELSQVFPQLGEGQAAAAGGDQAQAKLRLFESFVGLLELWAGSSALLLVIDDLHWADSSTRELLEYAARRLAKSRVMLLATYRSDELDRTHPLTRAVQIWRRSGLAESVSVEAMGPAQAGEMIAAILGTDEVNRELASAIHARAEGNPFVLEEMLKEAVESGELSAAHAFELPETVREAVLLRVARLDSGYVEVLRAAAVLGRSFDYSLLAAVVEADEGSVLEALEAAVAQQLLEEDVEASDRYTWRHALTQEAILSDTALPKRLRTHSRAADTLLAADGSALAVARHLLAAGRSEDAIPACLRAAEEAERAAAYHEATELLERILPQVADQYDRAMLLYRLGRLRWLNGETSTAQQFLADAVERLDELELPIDAAKTRIYLGRCLWELNRPEESMKVLDHAREALEAEGPSAELALATMRIASQHGFQLDFEALRAGAQRAAEIAEEASADFERLWALSFVALGHFGSPRGLELFEQCSTEAVGKRYMVIPGNTIYNELWTRVQSLAGGLDAVVGRYEPVPYDAWAAIGVEISRSWVHLARGEPRKALEQARTAVEHHGDLGNPKFEWRGALAVAEALLELGRPEEAATELPPPSAGQELQDVAYDSAVRVGVEVALGRGEEAAELARRAVDDDRLLAVRALVPLAVEGLLAGGVLEEAEEVVRRAKAVPVEIGDTGLWLAEGRVLLARGDAAEARPLLERARAEFGVLGLRLWAWRAAALAGEAAAQARDVQAARELFEACIREAHAAGAMRARDAAIAAAERVGIEVPDLVEEPGAGPAAPDLIQAGERLVTSMFADVRGYTPIAAASAPGELADRITTLHRWAAAEVGKRQGIVDKFAGDAVMATFNATGARIDHATQALDAALALRDKAALMDLPVGIGIAVGPAVVSRSLDEGNVSVLGTTTNLAARLQTAAGGGDILLSDEAYRRVASWLAERGLSAEPEQLELKGFDGAQPAYRLPSPIR